MANLSTFENFLARLARITSSPVLLFTALPLSLAYAWEKINEQVYLRYAMVGRSPIFWLYKYFHPEGYPGDFPNGSEVYSSSLFMYVYVTGSKLFGAGAYAMLPWVIALEIAMLALAVYALSRAISPKAQPAVHMIVILLVITSWARDMNVAEVTQPSIMGNYHNAHDAFRLLAIAAALGGGYILSGILLAASYATQPTSGLIGGAFVLAMLIASKPEKEQIKKASVGAGIFVVLAAAWTLTMHDASATGAGEVVPDEMWFDLVKFLGVHFYPVDNGFFTREHHRFIQLLSLTLLLIYYLSRRPAEYKKSDSSMKAGLAMMAALVFLGVIFTLVPSKPILIKLALVRASELYIFIALAYVAHGLWRDIENRDWTMAALAAAALASPFYLRPGFPLALSFLLAAPAIYDVMRGKLKSGLAPALMALSIAGLVIVYISLGVGYEPWPGEGAFGSPRSFARSVYGLAMFHSGGEIYVQAVLTAAAIIGLPVLFIKLVFKQNLAPLAVLVILLFSQANSQNMMQMDQRNTAKVKDYMAAQLWAKDNTEKDSLFMVDPANYMFSGWREFSERACFGTLYEWVTLSILYRSDRQAYEEGLRRLGEFGLRLDDYLRIDPGSTTRFKRLAARMSELYNEFGDSWRMDLARRYGIGYFVMEKGKAVTVVTLPAVYQNDHFVIYSSGQGTKAGAAG